MPKFKKKNVKRKKPTIVQKKEYTPFPPEPKPSKVRQRRLTNVYRRQRQRQCLSQTRIHRKETERGRERLRHAQTRAQREYY